MLMGPNVKHLLCFDVFILSFSTGPLTPLYQNTFRILRFLNAIHIIKTDCLLKGHKDYIATLRMRQMLTTIYFDASI